MDASRAPRATASSEIASSCTITPLSARIPSMRAGASPVSVATSLAMRTAADNATGSIRIPRALSCGSIESVAWMLPRLKRSPASMRAAGSTLSNPGGMRNLRSSPRPLTLFTSQRQRRLPLAPGASAKPVILTRLMRDSGFFPENTPRGSPRKATSVTLHLDLAPLGHVFLVLGDIVGEDVPAGSVGHEIEVFGGVRRQSRCDGVFARVADGRRGQTRDRIGVEGRSARDLAFADAPAERITPGDSIDDRRIGLQLHAEPQAIDEDGRDVAAFGRKRRFLLHNRGQDQRLLRRRERQARRTRVP